MELISIKNAIDISKDTIKKCKKFLRKQENIAIIAQEIQRHDFGEINLDYDYIELKVKYVLKQYNSYNSKNFIPNFNNVIVSIFDLICNEKNLSQLKEEEISMISEKLLRKLIPDDKDFYDEYINLQKDVTLLQEIPKMLVEINENLSYKSKVITIENHMKRLNQKKKNGISTITLDFFDYSDNKFEQKLIENINDKLSIIISGPTLEEAMMYTLYILEKNGLSNTYIVDSREKWNDITNMVDAEQYKNVTFIANFNEEVLPIPNSSMITFINSEIVLEDENVISFGKRNKEISIEKLCNIMSVDKNEVIKYIEDSFNDYQTYQEYIFQSRSNSTSVDLNTNDIILSLIGAYNTNENSTDYSYIMKYFGGDLNRDLKFENNDIRVYNHNDMLFVLNKVKLIKSMKEIRDNVLDKFLDFSKEIICNYKYNSGYIRFGYDISDKMLNSIFNTLDQLMLHIPNTSPKINKMYEDILVEFSNDTRESIYAKLKILNEIKYQNPKLVIDELSILSNSIHKFNEPKELWGMSLYNIFESIISVLLYNEQYTLEAFKVYFKVYLKSTDNDKKALENEIEKYFMYISNDYPIAEKEKIEFIEKYKFKKELLDVIVDSEYRSVSYSITDIDERNNFVKITRDRLVNERIKYMLELQNMYVEFVEDAKISKVISNFNLSFWKNENSKLKESIQENKFTDENILLAILEIREILYMDYFYNIWEKNSNETVSDNWKLSDKLRANYNELLQCLENILSNKEYAKVYLFSEKRWKEYLIPSDISEEVNEDNIKLLKNQLREAWLQEVKEKDLKKTLFLSTKVLNSYDIDMKFIEEVMKKCKVSLIELLSENLENSEFAHIMFIGYFSKKEDFNIDELCKFIKDNIKNGNYKQELGCYLQHVNVPLEFIEQLNNEDRLSVLDYYNVYIIDDKNLNEFYNLFKDNKLILKQLEILELHNLEKINPIKEFNNMLKVNAVGRKNGMHTYIIESFYSKCIDYYEKNDSLENYKAMKSLTFNLISIIENKKFISSAIYSDKHLLFELLKNVKESDDNIAENIINTHENLSKAERNHRLNSFKWLDAVVFSDYSIDNVTDWVKLLMKDDLFKEYKISLYEFIGEILAKYFDKNEDIIYEIPELLAADNYFKQYFKMTYSNTIGIYSSGRYEVPKVFINRKDNIERLLSDPRLKRKPAMHELLNEVLSGIEYQIDWHYEKCVN